jgi:hypothetical protein
MDTFERSRLPMYEDLTVGSLARLDPDWINLDTLKKWLEICDKEHGTTCEHKLGSFATGSSAGSSYRSSTQQPKGLHQRVSRLFHSKIQTKVTAGHPQWLIDVQRSCLISARPKHRYAALSYVWGQVSMLKTVKDNLPILLKAGALTNYGDLVPKTIRQTIGLTKRLNIPFLWVDCLCIVQDDEENLHRQLQDMASIYASAYVTIVAANGWDANHGLRGIKGLTDPRQVSPNTATDIYESLQPHTSIWYSRGWTFQEMVFSRRTIMLQYQVAIWECPSASWHEATKNLKPNDASDPLRPQLNINPWGGKILFSPIPNPGQYVGLIRDYNIRKLTYNNDTHNAITGLLSVWSRSFHGGFISGLPQMYFEAALLWQPRDPMQRRTAGQATGNRDYHLPSWSWLGWEGEVYRGWEDESGFCPSLEGPIQPMNTSIHQWFHGNSWEDKKPITVSSTWYLQCAQRGEARQPLPAEWSSHSYGLLTYYSHKRFPTIDLEFPIPLPEADTQVQVPRPTRFLFCRALRGFFKGGRQVTRFQTYLGEGRHIRGSCRSLHLVNSEYKSVGMLILNIISSSEIGGSKRNTKPLGPKEGFELVAISARSFPIIRNTAQSSKSTSQYYNVLWIEWQDGVAYRKALGWIGKLAWESSNLEWIDLTLG